LIRIMVEGEDLTSISKIAEELASVVRDEN
jgi:hypothetical protein